LQEENVVVNVVAAGFRTAASAGWYNRYKRIVCYQIRSRVAISSGKKSR